MKDLCHLSLQKPPEFLFVAVDAETSEDVLWSGLKRLKTPFIELYATELKARNSIRKGHPMVFTILARVMAEDGFTFYESESGEWMTEEVPSRYLRMC